MRNKLSQFLEFFFNRPEIKEACLDQINKNLLYWEEQKKKEEVILFFINLTRKKRSKKFAHSLKKRKKFMMTSRIHLTLLVTTYLLFQCKITENKQIKFFKFEFQLENYKKINSFT